MVTSVPVHNCECAKKAGLDSRLDSVRRPAAAQTQTPHRAANGRIENYGVLFLSVHIAPRLSMHPYVLAVLHPR